ncbi:hypothetical protein [Xylanibacter rodentium]|jgi:hypothetical protein|uniref:hypothetical protein n=1 Tax=Xylanibacter rodentium TaxID=2736289 RepID=UPI000F4A66D3|nr:hypothetical protein [Xylanibacter rodentium]ROS88595.1 hypothetical protein EEL39_05545 [Muribaculaceae bacterium Isolate-080 (Janvier)]
MSFWNYIGEFFLFRWLFGKFRKSATKHDAHIEDLGASIDRDGKHLNDNHDEDIAPIDDAVTPIGDNLLGDSDNSEELDDLDIFMRNNNGKNHSSLHHRDYDSDYHSSGRHSSHNDWNSGSYNQSFDDFHDEQDDYDMMEDDF